MVALAFGTSVDEVVAGLFDGEHSPLTYGIELEVEATDGIEEGGYMPEEEAEVEVCYTDPRTECTEYTYATITLPEIEGDGDFDGPLVSKLSDVDWAVKEDSSLSEYHGGTMVECVSDVLSGPEGLCNIEEAVSAIDRYCTTNSSCGMHVHVGIVKREYNSRSGQYACEWDFTEMRPALDETFGVFEAAFFAMAGGDAQRRMGSSYCKPKMGRKGYSNHDRYRSLNLTNGETVEVRAYGPTTDVDDVKGAVALAVGICSWVFSGQAGICDFGDMRIDDPRVAMDKLLGSIDKPGFLPFDDPDEKEAIFAHCRMRAEEAAHSLKFA